jgi:hypothetical protein
MSLVRVTVRVAVSPGASVSVKLDVDQVRFGCSGAASSQVALPIAATRSASTGRRQTLLRLVGRERRAAGAGWSEALGSVVRGIDLKAFRVRAAPPAVLASGRAEL